MSEHRSRISAVVRQMDRGLVLLVCWWIVCAVGVAHAGYVAHTRAAVQSPRAASQQPVVRSIQPPVPTMARAASTTTSAALGVATNRTLNLPLLWDASPAPGITNYSIWWGIASGRYTNSANAGTNLTLTISNLVRGVRYYFAATCQDRSGAASPYSVEYFWPQPFTNYIGVGIKTNGRVILQLVYTNPPGDVVLFEPFIWQTNNNVSVVRLDTKGLIVGNTNTP